MQFWVIVIHTPRKPCYKVVGPFPKRRTAELEFALCYGGKKGWTASYHTVAQPYLEGGDFPR